MARLPARHAAPAPPAAPEGRRQRRRRETRERLLDATRRVIAESGLEAATIARIAEAADVGFGTFYSYFPSREAALLATVRHVLDRVAAENDALSAGLEDPAELLAIGLANVLALAGRDPATASFALALTMSGHPELWHALRRRMQADLRRGRAAGRFQVEALEVVIEMVSGGVMRALAARLEGRLGPDADVAFVTHVLRLLGVADAAEIARAGGRRVREGLAPAEESR
ncbi:MAG: helix-turn-helix domain containing protein [Deltaproteobacteria bacterium]|nr:helix-turn-helix domain containing protein [Deltaproteobacteria bacterium]